MTKQFGAALLFAAAIALTGKSAFAQATVNENESASVYVDAYQGSDDAAGANTSPVQSISAALEKAKLNSARGVGTKIVIGPGVYHESLEIAGDDAGAPITLEAASLGASVISGSDVVTGWARNGAVYTHFWNQAKGSCPVPRGWPRLQQIVLKKEVVFVNGAQLRQVLSRSAMRAGTFYYNEGGNQLVIWPFNGTNMGSARVEVGARPTLLSISHRSNVTVRGMVFQHATSCINNGGSVVVGSSSNILFDKDRFEWNNWTGLNVSGSRNVTVQNSVSSHNGGLGMLSYQNKNMLYQYNETDFNNWRGAWGGLYDWGMGGLKMMLTHGATVKNHFSYHNQAQGLWFDTDNENINAENETLIGNVWANLQIERNQGPITLSNSLLCSGGQGIVLLTSEHVTVSGTKFFNNGGGHDEAQVYLAGQQGGRTITNWETHRSIHLYTQNMTFKNNIVEAANGSQSVFGTYLDVNDFQHFAGSLSSNSNKWYNPQRSAAFGLPNAEFTTLNGWKGRTRQDSNSEWTSSSVVKSQCSAASPKD